MDPITAKLLIAGGTTLANGFFQQRSAAYNQKMAEKNQALNYKYAMMAQRNAPINEVYGLKAAGLSPTFANGAQGMAVSSGSSGTAQAPQIDPINLAMLTSQIKKTEAEAESIEIDNQNKKHRDTAYSVIMDNELDHLRQLYAGDEKAQEIIDMYKALPKSEGTYNAYERTLSMLPKTFGSRADLLAEHLREKVNQIRDSSAALTDSKQGADWIDNPFLKSLVTSDTAETDRTIADIAKLYADTDNIKETLDLIKKQKSLTDQDIERVKALANQIRNSDVRSMIERGDYTGALFSLLSGLIMGLGNYK